MDKSIREIFRNPIQIGMLTRDLEKTLKNLDDILGIGPFQIVGFPPEGEKSVTMKYYGEERPFKAKFCFFNLGNIEFEVIQPLEGETIWGEFLKDREAGLHHIKFLVPEHDPIHRHMASKGVSVSQMGSAVGKNAGREWLYYDTEKLLGFAVETMNQ